MKQIAAWMDRVISDPTDDDGRQGARRGRELTAQVPGAGHLALGRRGRIGGERPCTDDRRMLTALAACALGWPVPAGPRRRRAPRPSSCVDKTKLNAKIIHYYDGVYTVEANGQTMKLPKEKIRSISFQLPPARARVLDAGEDVRALAQGADRGRRREGRSTATR